MSKLHIIRFVKEEEVKLSYEIGTGKASEQLGLHASTLTGWRNAEKGHKDIAFVGSGNQWLIPTNMKEIQFMKRIKELERANSILKEALGFISKSQKKVSPHKLFLFMQKVHFGLKLQKK